MAKRSINSNIETHLINNEPFEYAHLIKFERPFAADVDGKFRTNANRYVYLTDGARDISFDDGTTDHDGSSNGSQVYRANRVESLGSYSETTEARATNMSLVLSAESLGLSVSVTGSFSGSTFAISTNLLNGEILDLVEEGFREGDKIKITKNSGNFSTGNNEETFIISAFSSSNQTITLVRTGDDTDDSAIPTDSSVAVSISLDSEELKSATLPRGTNASNPSFLNREVFIHKVFIDPDDGSIIGNTSVLVFKGIITACDLQEGATSTKVKWNLSSHWGDFTQVSGRVASDEVHRALDANAKPQPDLTVKRNYAFDLGFMHSETSLAQTAVYQTFVTKYKHSRKRRGGLAGLFGMKKDVFTEIQEAVDNDVNLNLFLQAKALPVVYGVQRIEGLPVFADTAEDNSKLVFFADAICEGEIHGVLNIFIDDAPLICTDKADFDLRNAGTGTGKEDSALQCYGRADRGDTLGGTGNNTSDATGENYQDLTDLYLAAEQAREEGDYETYADIMAQIYALENQYGSLSNSTVFGASIDGSSAAFGMQHEEFGTITHPYNMSFTFFAGRGDQKASNLLVTRANASSPNRFKRQSDYWTSNLPYWSPLHRLLDTSYMVIASEISAEQTSIPDLDYVVKGRVLDCYNYDGTYVPHPSETSAAHTNFKNGDTVKIQVKDQGTYKYLKSDGTVSTTESDGKDFRILHKYLFSTSRGTTHYRFILDSIPTIGTYTELRLKSSTNYWYMITHDFSVAKSANTTFTKYPKSATSISRNGSNEITMTFSSQNSTILKAGYVATDEFSYTFDIGDTVTDSIIASLEDKIFRVEWDGDVATIKGTNISSTQATYMNTNKAQIKLLKAKSFYLGFNTAVAALTDAADLEGGVLELRGDGGEIIESLEIVDFTPADDRVKTGIPATKLSLATKFSIKGVGRDKRASTNPAMQLLDYLTDRRYGKDLDLEDIDLASFKSTAALCDTRSDVTVTIDGAFSTAPTAGAIYKYVDSNSNHVWSGVVKSVDTTVSTSPKITFRKCSKQLIRRYYDYVNYDAGDLIYHDDSGTIRFYEVESDGTISTTPTHTNTSFTNGTKFLANSTDSNNISLAKVSGTGDSSLNIQKSAALTYSLYDADFIKYWRYLGWESHDQIWVTRHQTSHIIDTNKSLFDNVNMMLAHFNGILSYSNGKYVLDIETAADAPTASRSNGIQSNPEFIEKDDIIGNISLVDNSNRMSRNTIKASIFDPQNNWGSRSVTFFNSDFLKADRNVIKTGNSVITGITNYYNARILVEKELIHSRFSKEITFTLGPRGLLLKPGQVISVDYSPFGFESKRFRVENLTFQPNCNVSVKAREYDESVYIISSQRRQETRIDAVGSDYQLKKPGSPSSLTATAGTKAATILLNWSNASDFHEPTDSVEIWESDSASNSSRTLLKTLDQTTTFEYALGASSSNKYFWVRTKRKTTRSPDSNETVTLFSAFHPTGDGVVGNAAPAATSKTISLFQKQASGGAATNQPTTAGTFASPTNGITGWSETKPALSADGDVIYEIRRVFTSDGESPQESNWSTAVIIARRTDGTDGSPGSAGARGGSIFTFEESSTSQISATNASEFAQSSITTAAAQAAAAAVIAEASDSKIQPNDRITITDNSANKAGTRVYTGTEASSSSGVATSDFSSLVTENFDGSVIVAGTLSADRLSANTTTTNTLNVGSSLILNSSGKIHTTDKTSFSDTTAGFFLGNESSAFKFAIGSSTEKLEWDGTSLKLTGTLEIGSGSNLVKIDSDTNNDFRIMAGGTNASAPFSVSKTGDVVANKISIKKDGVKYFDSDTGFTQAAFSQIAQNLGSTVTTFAYEQADNSTAGTKIANSSGSAITLSFIVKVDVRSFTGSDSSSPDTAYDKIPTSLDISVEHAATASTNASDYTTVGSAMTFTKDSTQTSVDGTSLSPASGTLSSTDYGIQVLDLTQLNGGYVASTDLFSSGDAVDSSGDLTVTYSTTYSLAAGTTKYFRAKVAKTGGDSATANNATLFDRVLEITDDGGTGFTVDGSGGSSADAAGDITGVTAGTGLSGGGASGTVTLDLDMSELTDMTATMVGTDEFIVLDAGADRRKAASEIGLSIFNNDSGFTTNVGDITAVVAGDGLTGGATSGSATLNIGAGTGIDVAADAISVDVSDFMTNGANNRILTATGTDGINAESNMTFSGSVLDFGSSNATVSGVGVIGIGVGITSGSIMTVNGVEVMTVGRNLTNIGTISSGAITATGNLHAGDGTDISMDASANGQLEVDGNGYQGAIALGSTTMAIYHNSSSRSLTLGTNETARIIIGGSGGVNFNNNNITSTGTITNGQFTIPNAAGTAGQVLKWPSSGTTLEWADDSSGGGATTINNNAAGRVIFGSNTANTLEADSEITRLLGGIRISDAPGSGSFPHIQLNDSTGTNQYANIRHDSGVTTIQSQNGSTTRGSIKFYGGQATIAGFDADGNFEMGTTDVITSARALQNIVSASISDGIFVGSTSGAAASLGEAGIVINTSTIPQILFDGGSDTNLDIAVPTGEILQIGHWDVSANSATLQMSMETDGDFSFEGNNIQGISNVSTSTITATSHITITGDNKQLKFTGTAGPLGLEFGDSEANPNFRVYYRTSPNTLTFENNGETAKHTFDLSGNYTNTGDITVGDLLIMAGGNTKAIGFTGTGSDTNVRHFAYENSGHHYVTNRHTDGQLNLMSNNGTGGGELTRITLQAGSGTQDVDITNANLDLNSNNIKGVGVHLVGIASSVGVGATPADSNSAELGPGYLNLARDDTADAKQILFGKNGAVHSYMKTTSTNNGLVIGCSTSDVLTVNSVGIVVTGSITATGDVTAFQSSDERLKTNIVRIDSALNKVSQISGYHFDWKDMDEAPHDGSDVGVIAQEIEAVLPEVVTERDNGYKAVNYQKLTALLIEAVKELKEEIDELKKQK